jgi:hypothetical protein
MGQSALSFLALPIVWIAGLAVAAFLVLYWALRGAPIGQAVEEEAAEEVPGASYRDRVVAAAVVGVILIGVGAYVAVAVSIPWSLPLFAVGFGVVITLASTNRRYRHASPTFRRLVAFADMAVNAALLAGILIVGNVVAFKYGGRSIDFTSEGSFSLSRLTIRQLKDLDRPLTFTTFFGRDYHSDLQILRIIELLDLYRAENPAKIRIEQINYYSEADRDKVETLQKRVPDVKVAIQQGGGLVIEYGEGAAAEHVVLRAGELFEITRPSATEPGRFESRFNGEDAITSALIRLKQGEKPLVVFTTGHGEPSIEHTDPNQPGSGLVRARLESLGSEVVSQSLFESDIAPKTSLVIIAGPVKPFSAQEIRRLKGYLDRGGHALVLIDREKVGLEDLLRLYHIEIGSSVVIDPVSSLRGRPRVIAVPIRGIRSPILDSLANTVVLLSDAAPLTLAPNDRSMIGPITEPLLRTSSRSWAETDVDKWPPEFDDKKDTRGPLVVAATVADPPKAGSDRPQAEPRLVIFASRSFADNQVIQADPVNLDLVLNAVHWLRGRPELQGIMPKTHTVIALVADRGLRARLVLVPTLLAFCVIIGFGFVMYLVRRS